MTLGQNIYRLRTERGLSQGDLAEALDVSRQSVSKWETDGSVPELEKLRRLSELFHISLDALVGGEAAPEAPKARAPLPETLFLAPLDVRQGRRLRRAGAILLGIGLALPWLAAWAVLPALVLSIPALLGGIFLFLRSLPELPGDAPIPQSSANTQRLVGGILLGCGMLVLLWLRTQTMSLLPSFWLPFLLCGALLLTLRRRAWLPCLWVWGWGMLCRWQFVPLPAPRRPAGWQPGGGSRPAFDPLRGAGTAGPEPLCLPEGGVALVGAAAGRGLGCLPGGGGLALRA